MPFGFGIGLISTSQLADGAVTNAKVAAAAAIARSKLAAANLLTGITPSFAYWTTAPGTNADLVAELVDTLTTNGVSSGAGGTIVYDLGSSKRVAVSMMQNGGGAAGAGAYISDDNVTYYFRGTFDSGVWATFVAKARYIQFSASATKTFDKIKLIAYEV